MLLLPAFPIATTQINAPTPTEMPTMVRILLTQFRLSAADASRNMFLKFIGSSVNTPLGYTTPNAQTGQEKVSRKSTNAGAAHVARALLPAAFDFQRDGASRPVHVLIYPNPFVIPTPERSEAGGIRCPRPFREKLRLPTIADILRGPTGPPSIHD